MGTDTLQIAIYSRKSRFTGKGESIGNQIDLCRDYVRSHYGEDWLNRIVIFEDEGFSGGNLNRPDFQKMMRSVRNRRFKAIIVYRLDRISRNISDFAGLIDELTKLDVSFVSIREQFDTGTPMGRAMMFIISVFSQLERETIAERIRDNMHELAKTGRWLGGVTPTGFSSECISTVTVEGKTRKSCHLKVIPREIEKIRLIFDLYCETGSLTMTEAELLRRHVFSKNDKPFTRYTLKVILRNPVYAVADEDTYHYFLRSEADVCFPKEAFDGTRGILAYHRTDQEKGRRTTFLPTNRWIIAVGRHPGVIPSGPWIHVQELLNRNKSGSYHQPRGNEALLTGLIFCSCGSRMYPKVTTRKTDAGEIIFPYLCKMKERSKGTSCALPNPSGNSLDAAVMEQIRLLPENPDVFLSQLKKIRRTDTGNNSHREKDLVQLRREAADTEKKITQLIDAMVAVGESTAKVHMAKRVEELDAALKDIQSRMAEPDQDPMVQDLSGSEQIRLCGILSSFHALVPDMTLEQKRSAIRTLVRKVVWDGTTAHIFLSGTDESAEPSRQF